MDVFYRLVDNDSTLKQRATRVYFNGFVWTTVIDVKVLTIMAVPFYVASYFVSWRMSHFLWVIALMLLHLVADRILLPRVVEKHISLSNEQLEYIRTQLRADLCARLKQLAGTP